MKYESEPVKELYFIIRPDDKWTVCWHRESVERIVKTEPNVKVFRYAFKEKFFS